MGATKILSIYGTVLSESELGYRKKCVADSKSGVFCPITHKPVSVMYGELLYINGNDYFISNDGLKRLENIYGEEFIKSRIITYD